MTHRLLTGMSLWWARVSAGRRSLDTAVRAQRRHSKCYMLVTALLVLCSASESAFAWRVYNNIDVPIRARISSLEGSNTCRELGLCDCGAWESDSGIIIRPGDDAGPNWNEEDCNPTGRRDSTLVMQIFIDSDLGLAGDLQDETGLDLGVTRLGYGKGKFQCFFTMRGGGSGAIRAQGRYFSTDIGTGNPKLIGANYYCDSMFDGALVDSTDPFARQYAGGYPPPMHPGNRDLRFLVTGDPQYGDGLDDSYDPDTGAPKCVNCNKDADRTLAAATNVLRNSAQVRGLIVAGDLTQNGRFENLLGCGLDEMTEYVGAITGLQRYVFEGLGNHDVEDLDSSCQDLERIRDYVGEKARNTVLTGRPEPERGLLAGDPIGPGTSGYPSYSWDWHDLHFVQLNLFPGDAPSPQFPGLDPLHALTMLKADLQANVGHRPAPLAGAQDGRPVVLIHHYGFDTFSVGAGYPQVWWTAQERVAYWNAIKDYNVIAIFNGHAHLGSGGTSFRVDFTRPTGALSRPDGRTSIPGFNAAALRGSNVVVGDGVFLDVTVNNANQLVVQRKNDLGTQIGGSETVQFSTGCWGPNAPIACYPNTAPYFMSLPPVIATPNEAGFMSYIYNIQASDAENQVITITATSNTGATKPPFMNFVDNGDGTAFLTATGIFNETLVGSHAVILEVSDGIAPPVQQSFMVTYRGSGLPVTTFTLSQQYPQTSAVAAFRDLGAVDWPFTCQVNVRHALPAGEVRPDVLLTGSVTETDATLDPFTDALLDTHYECRAVGSFDEPGNYTGQLLLTDTNGVTAIGPSLAYMTMVTMPTVVGLSQAAAQTAISGAGLNVGQLTHANSSSVPAGYIISQGVPTGAAVEKFDPVDLVVSDGPLMVETPGVAGFAQAAAESAITAADLAVGGITTATSSDVPEGYVISQNPTVGALAPAGSSIDLVISVGPFRVVALSGIADSSPGSLRDVIAQATAGDVVAFEPGYSGATIALVDVLLIDKDLTIDASSLTGGLTISGQNLYQVFSISGSAHVVLKNLTIAEGLDVSGGCIDNDGVLELIDSTVHSCEAYLYGGGIMNGGSITLTNVTVSGNQSYVAGAIYNSGIATLVHVTIADNHALGSSGTGGMLSTGTLHVENSIIARNTGLDHSDIWQNGGAISHAGNNLIGSNSNLAAFPPSALVGTPEAPLDPRLAPLAAYGGGPPTMMLFSESPAIDAALPTVATPAADQRGVLRPQGAAGDIGAVEVVDADSDGLDDVLEQLLGTSPLLADTDGDGLSDLDEVIANGNPSDYQVGVDTDPLNADTDGDGVSDGDEVAAGTNPLVDEVARARAQRSVIVVINAILLDE